MVDLGTPRRQSGVRACINDSNQIAGSLGTAKGIVINGSLFDLNPGFPPIRFPITDAVGINTSGQILCDGTISFLRSGSSASFRERPNVHYSNFHHEEAVVP